MGRSGPRREFDSERWVGGKEAGGASVQEDRTDLIDIGRHRHLLLALYVAALLAATLTPVPGSVYPPSGFDKLVHVVLFAGLAFLISWNVRSENYAIGAVESLLLTVAAAVMIEATQGILPFRDADDGDLLAGALGAVLGIAVAGVLRVWMRSGKSPAKP